MIIQKLKCKSCKKSWFPRVINGKVKMPGTCAKCRSPTWNKDIKRRKK